MTITSKFHPVNAILGPTLLVLVLSALSYLIAFLSFLDVNNGKVDSIFKTPIYGSVLLFAAVIGLIHHYLKTCKKIQLNNQGMSLKNLFSSEFISWNEIKKIELIGKSRNRMINSETTNLDLKSGKEIDIIASYYQNMGTLRIALEQVQQSLNTHEPINLNHTPKIPKTEHSRYLNLSEMNKYSGNHFLSLNGIMIYGWIGLLIFLLIGGNEKLNMGFGLGLFTTILIFFYSFFGYQLHNFYLGEDHLIVKNHVWPWKQKVFSIADIKEVVFERPYRKSISLRVITDEYQSKLYPAGSLRHKTWQELEKDLRSKKVKVRNEAL